MTLGDWAILARAPQRLPGTEVTVRATPVRPSALPSVADHMFQPGMSATDAIKPAQADAARVNQLDPLYGVLASNSNSLIGGFTKSQYGRRIGDRSTLGYDTELLPMRNLPDVAPYVRYPAF